MLEESVESRPAGQVEGGDAAVVLVVNVGPGLQQVGDVGEASLLTGGIVQRSPAQPVPAVEHPDHLVSLVPEDQLDDALTPPPHCEVERSGTDRVQRINVSFVINQQLEHLVGSIEGRVVQRSLVILVLDVHWEGAAVKEALDHLGEALGGGVVEERLLGVFVDIKLWIFLGEPDENVVASVNV